MTRHELDFVGRIITASKFWKPKQPGSVNFIEMGKDLRGDGCQEAKDLS